MNFAPLPGSRGVAIALALAMTVLASGSRAQQAGGPASPKNKPVIAERARSLAEVEERRLGLQKLRSNAETLLARRSELSGYLPVLEHAGSQLPDASAELDSHETSRIGIEKLLDEESALRAEARQIEQARSSVAALLRDYDRALDNAEEEQRSWEALLQLAHERAAPATLVTRIESIRKGIEGYADRLREARDESLTVLDRATTLMVRINAVGDEVSRRRAEMHSAEMESVRRPLWVTRPMALADAAKAQGAMLRSNAYLVERYVDENTSTIIGLFAGTFAFVWLVLRASRRMGAPPDWGVSATTSLARVMARPTLSAATLATLALYFAPLAPQAVYHLIGFILPLPIAYLAARGFASPVRLTVYTLAAALSLFAIRSYIELLPLLGRVVVIGECFAVAAALLIDWRRGGMGRLLPGLPTKFLRFATWALVVALLGAAVGEMVGEIGVSRTLRTTVVAGLGLALIAATAVEILQGVYCAALRVTGGSLLLSARDRPAATLAFLRRVTIVIATTVWLVTFLNAAGMLDAVQALGTRIIATKFEIGSAVISLSSIVLAFAIAVGTWLTIITSRFVLEAEILPRLRPSPGVGYMVSALLRYGVGLLGFLLIVSALGIDITKITVIVGALGIGIGFGLQNVVNNFVSGLILLFERPVKIGDTVVLDTLTGTIRHIGIRATTIRTFDGAEVIVPNADLISKQLANWTLSDRQRRAEVAVGVSYGSDVDTVRTILLEAVREHPAVLAQPKPFAWFVGFGDSSLDFKVYGWVADADTVSQVSSELRAAILARFRDAGIEIPFPQRDLHVRSNEVALGSGAQPGA